MKHPIEVIPAIMPATLADLDDKVRRVSGLTQYVQLDIMDGRFVPPATWPYTPGGRDEFERIVREDEGLPGWESVRFEIDLMVADPHPLLEKWIAAGAGRIVVYIESVENFSAVTTFFQERFRKDEEFRVELGAAIKLHTEVEKIFPHLDAADFVQVMGIARQGYSGERLDERVFDHVTQILKHKPDAILSVDGGVNTQTAPRLVRAGVRRLVAQSAVFGAPDPTEAIEALRNS